MITGQISRIEKELQECVGKVDEDICQRVIEEIEERTSAGKRIFAAGLGRTGYIVRGLSMRLMQAGMESFWIGDTATPAAELGDLLIIGSGSGETETLKGYARVAKEKGLFIILFTADSNSTLGRNADIVVEIHASTKFGHDDVRTSSQPMGTLFEQSAMILMDAMILEMIERGTVSVDAMTKKHANLE